MVDISPDPTNFSCLHKGPSIELDKRIYSWGKLCTIVKNQPAWMRSVAGVAPVSNHPKERNLHNIALIDINTYWMLFADGCLYLHSLGKKRSILSPIKGLHINRNQPTNIKKIIRSFLKDKNLISTT